MRQKQKLEICKAVNSAFQWDPEGSVVRLGHGAANMAAIQTKCFEAARWPGRGKAVASAAVPGDFPGRAG